MTRTETTPSPKGIDTSSRGLIRLSAPVILSLVAQNLIGVVDTAFVGRLGEAELGGTSMAGMVYFSIYTVGYGLASGAQIMMGQRYGAGQHGRVGHVLGQSFLMLIAAAVLILAIAVHFGELIFGALLRTPEVASVSIEYWEYRVWGFIFGFVSSGFRAFFVATSRTQVLTYTAVVMSVVNVALDYALINGNLGAPALGVRGAAIASVVAEASAMIFYMLYLYRRIDLKHFGIHLQEILRIDPALIRQLFGISIYLVLQALVSQSVWTVFFFFIESLGARELAVASIVKSMYILLYMPINSYGTAVRTTVSQLVGGGYYQELRAYMRRVAQVSFGTVLIIGIIINLLPELVLGIFTDSTDLIQDCVPALRVVTIALLVSSVGNMYFGALSATGRTKSVFVIELINTVVYFAYSGVMVYILQASIALCFTVEIIYYMLIALMSYWLLSRYYFEHPNTPAPHPDATADR